MQRWKKINSYLQITNFHCLWFASHIFLIIVYILRFFCGTFPFSSFCIINNILLYFIILSTMWYYASFVPLILRGTYPSKKRSSFKENVGKKVSQRDLKRIGTSVIYTLYYMLNVLFLSLVSPPTLIINILHVSHKKLLYFSLLFYLYCCVCVHLSMDISSFCHDKYDAFVVPAFYILYKAGIQEQCNK